MNHFDIIEGTGLLIGKTDSEVIELIFRPSVFHIAGKDCTKAVLVSALIHGHEVCGLRAILAEVSGQREYPFDMYFFVGNVAAAKVKPVFSNRMVPGGQNFNRVWVDNPVTDLEKTAAGLFSFFKSLPLIGILDLHSFTSHSSPKHAFVSTADENTLCIAKRLAPHVFVTDDMIGTMIEKTAGIAPSIVVECGTNGTIDADTYASKTLEIFFKLMGVIQGNAPDAVCKREYRGLTNIKILQEVSVSWADQRTGSNLTVRKDIESLNIKELSKNELFGWGDSLDVFSILTKNGKGKPEDFFEIKQNTIYIKKGFVPALLAAKESISKESGFYLFKV